MAHYAQIDLDGNVVEVFVGRDENDLVDGVTDWETYYAPEGFVAKRTSYNTYGGVHYITNEEGIRVPSEDQTKAFRKNYAEIGFTYDEERDAFIPPKPHESWVLNEDTCLWDAPVPYPEEGGTYRWDEETTNWILIPEPS
jgi:hypothetical protein